MANLKTLAKDTAIYGLSSIIGRFLNYLLVPLYTYIFTAASGGYGVVTNLYAYTAFFLVLLTYGMETTFFRFANKEGEDPRKVYSTILTSVGTTSTLFVALVFLFLGPISRGMGYADHPSYIWTMAVIVALDAFQAIMFSYLRYQRRPVKFAALKLLFIIMNITLNLLILVLLPKLAATHPWAARLYNPEIGVGYVFYINLFCTAFVTFFFWKELKGIAYGFDRDLMKRLLSYSWPILILGLAGILNQTADKMIFPWIYKGADASVQLGLYGAASKIAMIMALITQAFRYAYEPLVFGSVRDKDNKKMYADGMKYFIIFTLLAYLCVMGYLDILKHLLRNQDYWEGLKVVPIVMAAEIMMGIYFNLSFWYKLIDKTIWGAVFSGIGCVVLLAVNFIFVPKYGYMACAWGGFAGYGVSMLLSYFVGQKHYPIAYPMKDILMYTLLSAVLLAGILLSNQHLPFWPEMLVNTALILVFVGYILWKDLPLSNLPVVGKYFKK